MEESVKLEFAYGAVTQAARENNASASYWRRVVRHPNIASPETLKLILDECKKASDNIKKEGKKSHIDKSKLRHEIVKKYAQQQ